MSIEQLMKRIHAYLADNQAQGFMRGDLASRIKGRSPELSSMVDGVDFDRALKRLVKIGSAIMKESRGTRYYSHGSHFKS